MYCHCRYNLKLQAFQATLILHLDNSQLGKKACQFIVNTKLTVLTIDWRVERAAPATADIMEPPRQSLRWT
jgi:hypothetical protein